MKIGLSYDLRTDYLAEGFTEEETADDGGRVDLRVDEDGTPNIMEVNPLAGLHPEHSDLCILARQAGITYKSLIGTIMSSAIKRYPSTSRGI